MTFNNTIKSLLLEIVDFDSKVGFEQGSDKRQMVDKILSAMDNKSFEFDGYDKRYADGWIAERINGLIKNGFDATEIGETLAKFAYLVKFHSKELKSVHLRDYVFSDLKTTVTSLYSKLHKEDSLKYKTRAKRDYSNIDGANLVLETDKFQIYRIDTKEASIALGDDTEWCISRNDIRDPSKENLWDNYSKYTHYFLIKKVQDPDDNYRKIVISINKMFNSLKTIKIGGYGRYDDTDENNLADDSSISNNSILKYLKKYDDEAFEFFNQFNELHIRDNDWLQLVKEDCKYIGLVPNNIENYDEILETARETCEKQIDDKTITIQTVPHDLYIFADKPIDYQWYYKILKLFITKHPYDIEQITDSYLDDDNFKTQYLNLCKLAVELDPFIYSILSEKIKNNKTYSEYVTKDIIEISIQDLKQHKTSFLSRYLTIKKGINQYLADEFAYKAIKQTRNYYWLNELDEKSFTTHEFFELFKEAKYYYENAVSNNYKNMDLIPSMVAKYNLGWYKDIVFSVISKLPLSIKSVMFYLFKYDVELQKELWEIAISKYPVLIRDLPANLENDSKWYNYIKDKYEVQHESKFEKLYNLIIEK